MTSVPVTVLLVGLLIAGAYSLPTSRAGSVPAHTGVPGIKSPFAGAYLINTTDPNVWPNSGAAMNITQFSLPPYQGKGFASFQVAVDELVNSTDLIAVGLEANWTLGGSTAYPFAAVLSIVTDQLITFSTGNPVPVGSLVQVRMTGGSNGVWTASVNGLPILNYSAGVQNVSTPSDTFVTVTSSSQDGAWLPQEILLPDTLEVLNSTHWYRPQNAFASWVGNGTAPLNISGEVQNSSLFSGEFMAGTSFASIYRGAQLIELWNRTPILDAQVSGAVAPTPLVSGTVTNVSWRVTSQGRVLPGVCVSYWSNLGGAPGTSVTDVEGYANSTYPVPRVTGAATFELTSMVLNDSVFGSGNLSAKVLPSGTETLTISLHDHVQTNGTARVIALAIEVMSGGKPAAGVTLLPSASIGGGSFSPYAPWVTDSNGMTYGNYTAPENATEVTLWVNASGLLYSGSAAMHFVLGNVSGNVSAPPSDETQWLVIAIGLGIVAGILFNVGIWFRRRERSKAN